MPKNLTGEIASAARSVKKEIDVNLLKTPGAIKTAARLLAAEAQHARGIQTHVVAPGIATNQLNPFDTLRLLSGKQTQSFSVNPGSGLIALLTADEVPYLAFGMNPA